MKLLRLRTEAQTMVVGDKPSLVDPTIMDGWSFKRDETERAKSDAIAALVAEYRGLRDGEWAGYPGYDAWFEQDLNNAHLASVGTYSTLVPEFQRLLASLDGDLSAFHAAVKELGRLDFEERRRRLDRT